MRIALFGYAGVGKDYIVKYYFEKLGYTRLSFSDQLKIQACQVFDWLEKDYPPELKEIPLNITTTMGELITKTPREIWLEFNLIRRIENNIFIRTLKDQLEYIQGDIVISDIRTQEEWNFAKEEGFMIIKISSENSIHGLNDFDKQQDSFDFDFEYNNKMNGIEDFIEFMK